MGELLYNIGQLLTAGFIKRALAGAGLGLTTYLVISTLLNKLISRAVTQFNSMDDAVFALLGIANVDVALSIVLSALMVRTAIVSAQVHLVQS